MGSLREKQLGEGHNFFQQYHCKARHINLNNTSNNIVTNNALLFSTHKPFANNISNGQIQENYPTINDNVVQKSPMSNEAETGQNDKELKSVINGHICAYELLSGFPDVSYWR